MKTIKGTITSTGLWLKTHARMHTVVALLVLAVGLAATFYYWDNLRHSVTGELQTAYNRQATAIGRSAAGRLALYESYLRGGASFYSIEGDDLTQAQWTQYAGSFDISRMHPDIEGLGISRYLTSDDVSAFVAHRQNVGDTNYTITPSGDRSVYVPVMLNARFTNNNGKNIGFDGYTEATRHSAMDYAIQTGQPAMSGAVDLVSSSGKDVSFIVYVPVFKPGQPTDTVDQRQSAIAGFAYVAVHFKPFIDAILSSSQSTDLGMQVFDTSQPGDAPIYQSNNFSGIQKQYGSITNQTYFNLYGHRWRAVLDASPALITDHERDLPAQALWRGVLSCVFFAGLVWYLITDRERKYARQKQEEVQTAKDDLLSLASHQLRTPATVVKQYVGMLLQGYAGDLTKQQINMLSSAYESNERQLEIINQLLYVARLDAGRITLHKERTDISRLLQDVARDQGTSVAERSQQLTFKLSKRPVTADVDPHYMRMVLENLLSNAIKYTPVGGSITLSAKRVPGSIDIRVQDTGVGIDPSVQDNVFDKFTRVENELSTDVNGSGVGLYLTKQIVELHGGNIEVKSALGQGATFIVKLPGRLLPKARGE